MLQRYCPRHEVDRMNLGTLIGLVSAFIILLLLFIFSVIAWELFKRDFD
jgi:hypothetical protein